MATIQESPRLNKYQKLERALAEVASGWTESDAELRESEGTRSIHIEMSQAALRRAFELEGELPESWASPRGGIYDGVRVLALYSHFSSLAAAKNKTILKV